MKNVSSPQKRERKKRQKKQGHIWPFLLAGFLLVLGMTAFFLFRSSYFAVRTVRLEGNYYISQEELSNAMGPMEGNIFLFPIRRTKQRIEATPGVRSVEITRSFPNELIVRIAETFIVARVDTPDAIYFVDEKGMVTDQYIEETNRVNPLPMEVSQTPVLNQPVFEDGRNLELLLALQRTTFRDGITKVRFENSSSIDIIYGDIVIHFGAPNDILNKLNDLAAVLKEISNKGIRTYEIILNEGKNPIVVTDDVPAEASESTATESN